jgi:heme-degrading monooxygenase HmoA
MIEPPPGSIAVIFISRRTAEDDAGYAAAAAEMDEAVRASPGFLGMDAAARSADGTGITICYWQDEAGVAFWREHERHTEVRQQGRSSWYHWYKVIVTRVERGYAWTR